MFNVGSVLGLVEKFSGVFVTRSRSQELHSRLYQLACVKLVSLYVVSFMVAVSKSLLTTLSEDFLYWWVKGPSEKMGLIMSPALRPVLIRPALSLRASSHCVSFIGLTAKDEQTWRDPSTWKKITNKTKKKKAVAWGKQKMQGTKCKYYL